MTPETESETKSTAVVEQTYEPIEVVHKKPTSLLDVSALMLAAQNYPRVIHKALDNAIAICTMDEETATECFYALPRAGKKISGPSIGLAETLASCWGNLTVSVDDVDIGDSYVRVNGWVIDTQSGLSYQGFERRRITKSSGERYNDDMINNTIGAAQSILYRNLVLRVIPRPMVRKVYNAARNVALGDAETSEARKDKLVKYWAKKGIKKEKLLSHLGCSRIEQITLEDIDYLLGIDNAIKAGETTVEKIFSKPTSGETVSSLDGLADNLEKDDSPAGGE